MRPKYSIVLPTLHGGRTLAHTLPAMLRIDRDDVEWVISENHSGDATYEALREIVADDERVRVVRPPERLPLGKHLEFAYQQASGRWLSHLGDDDHLLPWRFELLDAVLDRVGAECGVVRGDYVRYLWPQYPELEKANSLDAASFDRRFVAYEGKTLARRLLNESHIHGGGAWLVRSDVVQAVRRRCGFFASPQHVEFFAMRAACAVSQQAATIGLPLFILGRHSKSSGTQYFSPRDMNREQTWDWSFEDPEGYHHSPFNWKSYSTLSLDAALTAQAMLPEELGDTPIAWREWSKRVHTEMMRLVHYGQLPSDARRDFLKAVRTIPAGNSLAWRWRTWRLMLRYLFRSPEPADDEAHEPSAPIELGEVVRWTKRIRGDSAGFRSIVELPAWLESATRGKLLQMR
jgi:hypothetical protein